MDPLKLNSGGMLCVLHTVIDILPELLWQDDWNGLKITYEKPHVERLWCPWEDYRILLHTFEPCAPSEAFMHPHPWASAVRILSGSYTMQMAEGDFETCGEVLNTFRLSEGAEYEMIRPTNWHRVIPHPGAPITSIMVISSLWPHFPKRTIESGLEELSPDRFHQLLVNARRRFNVM